MTFRLTILAFSVLILTAGCRSVSIAPTIQSIAKEQLGANEIIYNGAGTFALCKQQRAPDHPGRKIRFIVIRTHDRAVVHEGSFTWGYVKWISDESIEIFSGSGPGRDDNGLRSTINVNSRIQ